MYKVIGFRLTEVRYKGFWNTFSEACDQADVLVTRGDCSDAFVYFNGNLLYEGKVVSVAREKGNVG